MRIIQISGKGRVGKSTLAHLIAAQSLEKGYRPVLIPFADAIKKQAEQAGITKEKDSTAYREFCQQLGETRRAENPDYWIVQAWETIQEYMLKEIDNKKADMEHYEYVIIQDDVRYMNELAFGKDLAATQIFISGGDRTLSEHTAEWRNHESEKMANDVEDTLDNPSKVDEYDELFDDIIINDEDKKELERLVKKTLDYWLNIGYLELEEIDDKDE